MKQFLWIEKSNENLIKAVNKPLQIGLIAGQLTLKQDFAIHFISCPEKTEEDLVGNNDSTNSHSVKNNASESFDANWVVEHARQVSRMLPGGIYIIGMFIICDPVVLSNEKSKIQKTLIVLLKHMEKLNYIRESIPHQQRYFISIDRASKKLTSYSFDVTDKLVSYNPADFKFQSFIDSFSCVSTTANLVVNIPVPIKEEMISLEKKILYAVQSEMKAIWNSYATVDYQLIDEDESVLDNKKVKGKGGKAKDPIGQTFEVVLFRKHNEKNITNDIEAQLADIIVKFTGMVSSRAYIHSRGTYSEVLNYLKIDIIKSLMTRAELLCEEAQVNNITQVDEWSLVSPVRVFAKIKPSSIVCFSDYIFKDELESDVISRFLEILNITLNSSDFEYVEHSPSVAEVTSMLDLVSDKQSDINSDVASELSSSYQEEASNKKMYIAGGLVAAIATMGYSFMKLLFPSD